MLRTFFRALPLTGAFSTLRQHHLLNHHWVTNAKAKAQRFSTSSAFSIQGQALSPHSIASKLSQDGQVTVITGTYYLLLYTSGTGTQ